MEDKPEESEALSSLEVHDAPLDEGLDLAEFVAMRVDGHFPAVLRVALGGYALPTRAPVASVVLGLTAGDMVVSSFLALTLRL